MNGIEAANIRSFVVKRALLLVFLLAIFLDSGTAFAFTSGSYQMNGVVDHSDNSQSANYSLCSRISPVGVQGSSSSYVLKPALHCDTAVVVVPPGGGGGGRRHYCSNAVLEDYEQCDDGNLVNGDGCSASCLLEVQPPVEPPVEPPLLICGNGVLEPPEQCDDGNVADGDGCSAICVQEPEIPPQPPEPEPTRPAAPDIGPYVPGILLPVCGNSLVEIGEQCDDGNYFNGDGCSQACLREVPSPRIFRPLPAKKPLVYVTNDQTVFFFEQFPGSSDQYHITLSDKKRSYDLTLRKAPDGYFSFVLDEPLQDGFYSVVVRDLKTSDSEVRLTLEVRQKEPIESPDVTSFETEYSMVTDFDLPFVTPTSRPLLKGKTPLPATVGIYSSQLERTFIAYSDDEGNFEFSYPHSLRGSESETLSMVAHYENGYVSKPTVLNFQVEDLKCAADEVIETPSSWVLFLLLLIATVISLFIAGLVRRRFYSPASAKQKKKKALSMLIFSIFLLSSWIPSAYAVTTTPTIMPYEGVLKTPGGTPIVTAQDFRFSIWSDSDYDTPADFDGGGNIPGAAPGYSGYQEVQTVTPDATGYFQINIGSFTPIPDFILSDHLFLQVEVKPNGSANTSYELLDIDGAVNANDRQPFGTMPYARNADFLDNAEVGLTDGDLVILGAGDVFPISVIPGGTNADTFEIDSDDTGTITQLSFGDVLNNRILSFDPDGVAIADGWFDFSDDVNIQGDLTIIGTVNGVTIGLKNLSLQLQPEFNGTVLDDSGPGGHKGRLEFFYQDVDGPGAPNNVNHYKWSTQQPTLQDKDLVIRVRLPDNFTGFQLVPIIFRYRTDTALNADNEIDVTVEDSTGTAVGTITGNANLVSTSFTTTSIDFGGGGTFTAGTEITIRIKMYATNAGAAYVSDLTLNYIVN